MKILAINAIPRSSGNTAILLNAALDYANAQGHETEFVQLSKLDFRGCRSCLVCKLDKEPYRSNAECVIKDDLTDVLAKTQEADILLLGSPIYFGSMTADFYALTERLWFPALVYNRNAPSLRTKKVHTGIITTMNVADAAFYDRLLTGIANANTSRVGPTQLLNITDTCQFDDYSKYVCGIFDAEHKESRRITAESDDYKAAEQFMAGLLADAESGAGL